jgi:hypothetical protein
MHIDWTAIGQVTIAGLVAGVGTVVLFSIGMAALGRRITTHGQGRKTTPATTLAWSCFAACTALLGLSLYVVTTSGR